MVLVTNFFNRNKNAASHFHPDFCLPVRFLLSLLLLSSAGVVGQRQRRTQRTPGQDFSCSDSLKMLDSSLKPRANSTIASYNASIVNFYNGTGSLYHFVSKNFLFYFKEHSRLPQRWHCSCKFKSLRMGSKSILHF
jgi:hypothetical protein